MEFVCRLQPVEGGGFIVRFDDVPEAVTEGATREEALFNARDALEVALLGRMKDGVDLPRPQVTAAGRNTVPVIVSAEASAKLAFYEAFRSSGLTRVALARAIGKDEAEVRRMLDPYHATRLASLEAGLNAMGRRLTVTLEPA